MNFIAELKRRNVFRVGIAYVLMGWLLLQGADFAFDLVGAPNWVIQSLTIVVAIGLPIALFFAWAFEMTPEGIKREEDVDRSQSITPKTGRKLNVAIVVLLAASLAYFVWESRFSDRVEAGADPAVTDQAEVEPEPAEKPAQPAIDPKSVAVLPFANRSNLDEDEFFVSGIHDDLLTKLAKIGSLKVISRTSVERIAEANLPMDEIGQELGVATIMEGSVQRAGNQVRINVQLINAETRDHLWAEVYDRELSTDNLFAIQTEISEAIALALETELSPEEQQRISDRPTDNLVAYNAYLRGLQLTRSRQAEALDKAVEEFRRAVEIDPNFAQAWVGLADAAGWASAYGDFSMKEALDIRVNAVERALEIDPNLGEAWSLKATISEMNGDYDAAETEYLKSIELSPNNPVVRKEYAEFLGTYPDRYQEALTQIEAGVTLDPYWTVLQAVKANIYLGRREFERADEIMRRVAELNMESAAQRGKYAEYLSGRQGRLGEALNQGRRAVELDPDSTRALYRLGLVMLALDAREGLASVQDQLNDLDPHGYYPIILDFLHQFHDGELKAAAESARLWWTTTGFTPAIFNLGLVYAVDGRYEEARDAMLQAYPGTLSRDWDNLTEDYPQACTIGWVLQRSGHEQLGTDLIRMALEALERNDVPFTVDGMPSSYELCLVASGQVEPALDVLESRLDSGDIEWWWMLKAHPVMASINTEPRYHEAWRSMESRIAEEREQLMREGVL